MEVYAEMIPLRAADSCEFPISHTGGVKGNAKHSISYTGGPPI